MLTSFRLHHHHLTLHIRQQLTKNANVNTNSRLSSSHFGKSDNNNSGGGRDRGFGNRDRNDNNSRDRDRDRYSNNRNTEYKPRRSNADGDFRPRSNNNEYSNNNYSRPQNQLNPSWTDRTERKVRRSSESFNGTRLFIQNLSPDTTWASLKDSLSDMLISNQSNERVAFTSISVDTFGDSKRCGIIQMESLGGAKLVLDLAKGKKISVDGVCEELFVREDVQDGNKRESNRNVKNNNRQSEYSDHDDQPDPDSDTDIQKIIKAYDPNRSIGSTNDTPSSYNRGGPLDADRRLPPWTCNTHDIISQLGANPSIKMETILTLLSSRDAARGRRHYEASDSIREELRANYNVVVDDRIRTWWVDVNTSPLPHQSIRMHGNDGYNDNFATERSGRENISPPSEWSNMAGVEQKSGSPELSAIVNIVKIKSLLQKRDNARRRKDFKTADDSLLLVYKTCNLLDGYEVIVDDKSRRWKVIKVGEGNLSRGFHGSGGFGRKVGGGEDEDRMEMVREVKEKKLGTMKGAVVEKEEEESFNDSDDDEKETYTDEDEDYDEDEMDEENESDSPTFNSIQHLKEMQLKLSGSQPLLEKKPVTRISDYDLCLQLMDKYDAGKRQGIETMLKESKWKGREGEVLKKLRERYED